jgi:hypothetical protein
MKYNPEIEAKILAAIEANPDRDLVLPDWAYWAGNPQPYVYVEGRPVRLARVLYEKVIGPLPEGAGLAPGPGMDRRNVNPHRFVVTETIHQRAVCPNKHPYTDEDRQPDGSMRCHICHGKHRTGGVNPVAVNAAKTTCDQGHALVRRSNGRRRCLECPRANQKRYRQNRTKEKK